MRWNHFIISFFAQSALLIRIREFGVIFPEITAFAHDVTVFYKIIPKDLPQFLIATIHFGPYLDY